MQGSFNSNNITTNTRYNAFGCGITHFNTTEALVDTPIRFAGTVVGVYLYVSANTTGSASTWALRKNTVTQALSVSIGGGLTGVFEDTSTSIAVANTDTLNWQYIPVGVGTVTFKIFTCKFVTASEPHVTILTGGTSASVSADSTTTVFAPFSEVGISGTELQNTWPLKVAGTVSNLNAYISANGRSTTSTLGSRLNGSAGGQTISIGSGVTGLLEDASGSDAIGNDDGFTTALTTSTGGGTLTIIRTGYNFRANNQTLCACLSSGLTLFAAATEYHPGFGGLPNNTVQASATVIFRASHLLSRYWFRVSANTLDSSSTIAPLKNGSVSTLAISLPASTSGEFNDNANIESVVDGDTWVNKILAGGTGAQSMSMTQIGVVMSPPNPAYLLVEN